MNLSKVLIVIGVTVLAVFILARIFGKLNMIADQQPQLENTVLDEAPESTMNQDGEVDMESFEENQAVSEDDSLETIQMELKNTVILEEDFSDL